MDCEYETTSECYHGSSRRGKVTKPKKVREKDEYGCILVSTASAVEGDHHRVYYTWKVFRVDPSTSPDDF